MLDPDLPRSVLLCTREVDRLLTELRSHYELAGGVEASKELSALLAELRDLTGRELLGQGLHTLLDLVQRRLMAITQELAAEFFDPPQAVV